MSLNLDTSAAPCSFCGAADQQLRCVRCKSAFYCSRDHQEKDWAQHKKVCKKIETSQQQQPPATDCKNVESKKTGKRRAQRKAGEISSEEQNLPSTPTVRQEKSATQSTMRSARLATPFTGENVIHPGEVTPNRQHFRSSNLHHFTPNSNTATGDLLHPRDVDLMAKSLVKDLDKYGVCVIDGFLGKERGLLVRNEVLKMYEHGVFQDGQLVTTDGKGQSVKKIRSDRITWIDGKEPYCESIGKLMTQVDTIVMRANRMPDNRKLGDYVIDGRTKAMVACYPGSGTHYVKHVDNPHRDGRCITAIYYLNIGWNVQDSGGLLRIFPGGWSDRVADIEPKFDRMLFFWSDRRNPHEVQPAYDTRYAITLWYIDAKERRTYQARQQDEAPRPNKNQPV